MYDMDNHCDQLTVKGYTNTCAEKLAKKVGAKFVSLGIVPRPIKNLKVRSYVTENRVTVSWSMDSQVDGYEIYSDHKKWKVITDNRITSTTLYVGNGYREIYIRSYINQNGKKIYGKAKKCALLLLLKLYMKCMEERESINGTAANAACPIYAFSL